MGWQWSGGILKAECPGLAGTEFQQALFWRKLGQLTQAGFTCVPDHEYHSQYKTGSMLRREWSAYVPALVFLLLGLLLFGLPFLLIFKLEEAEFRLDRRKKYFPVRVVSHWNRLSREVVRGRSLELFEVRLGGVLRTLCSRRSLCTWQGIGTRWSFSSCPTQTIPWFYDKCL